MITTKNLTLKFKQATILQNISVTLHKGHITAFIGKSGAGKTSLLKCLANLYHGFSGDALYQGKPLNSLTTQQRVHAVGFVFQQFNLFPHLTVVQNCVQPQVTALGTSQQQAQKKASEVLACLGLSACEHVYPNQLSGGQQQRVAIARALVLEPQVLLFDEPSSALDPQATQALAQVLKDLSKTGITIGLCSHDVVLIKELLDCVYLIDGGTVVDQHYMSDGALCTTSLIGQFLGKLEE